ncbi:MAG TPA: hypothetical protein VF759_03660 [Allosphingosinicella sp.]|jgi:hypothetical protein
MPYRHAHWVLLLLFPLTALAFWPNYFGKLAQSPYALHAHGVTASLWIALLAFQGWSIHRRRNALHRSGGLASLALFPLFIAGGLLVIQTMAVKFAAGGDPFYAIFGARLGAVDSISSAAMPWLFYLALKERRKVHLHARYMLAPVLFLLPPILSRLTPALPPLAIAGPADFHRFGYGVHIADAVAIAVAALLYLRAPKWGRPWLIVGFLVAAQSLAFETLGRTAAWEALFAAIGTLPAALVATIGLAAGAAAAWAGWAAGRPPMRAAATA